MSGGAAHLMQSCRQRGGAPRNRLPECRCKGTRGDHVVFAIPVLALRLIEFTRVMRQLRTFEAGVRNTAMLTSVATAPSPVVVAMYQGGGEGFGYLHHGIASRCSRSARRNPWIAVPHPSNSWMSARHGR